MISRNFSVATAVGIRFFADGDFAICRLTPDKYHYNHLPVSGRVVDIYEVDGCYHSCNPLASVAVASIYSKNRRVVTVIDTDVWGGSQVGLVVMVEIVALMIGDIVQAYSEDAMTTRYRSIPVSSCTRAARRACTGPAVQPTSCCSPRGGSNFFPILSKNSRRLGVQSRFTDACGRPLVETDIRVRSALALQTQGNL